MFFKHALVYMWMIFSMGYKIMKTEWYELNIGNKKIIYRKTVDGLFCTFLRKRKSNAKSVTCSYWTRTEKSALLCRWKLSKVPGSGNGKKAGIEYAKVKVWKRNDYSDQWRWRILWCIYLQSELAETVTRICREVSGWLLVERIFWGWKWNVYDQKGKIIFKTGSAI